MEFEKIVRFNGIAPSGYRETYVFDTAFNPIRRIFDYDELREAVYLLFIPLESRNRAKQLTEVEGTIIGTMHGGMEPHVVLDLKAVHKRLAIALLLKEALTNDLSIDYGTEVMTQVIVEARTNQLQFLEMAIQLFQSAIASMNEAVPA